MKRLIRVILTTSFLICSSVCFPSSYLIQLRNGAEFTTYQYWEEGDQIKFCLYGGVVGVQKDFVRKIEGPGLGHRGETAAIGEPEPVHVKAEPKAETKTQTVASPMEDEKKDDKRFMKEFFLLKEKFKDVYSMTNEELYRFAEDLMGFRNKVIKSGLGHLYSDQFLEVYEMADEVEAALKARGQ